MTADTTPANIRAQVLVVEDDSTTRWSMVASLRKAGFSVTEAQDGEQALARFAEIEPSVVFLDVELPRLDGYETCRRLRRTAGGADVPIVMVTAFDDAESVNRAYHSGATDFIFKPINWTILEYRARYLLRSYQNLMRLKDSEARLAKAQRIARVGNFEWSITEDRICWSKEALRILGLDSAGSGTGPNASMVNVHPEDKVAVETAFRLAAAEGRAFDVEHRVICGDGRERFVHQQGQPLRSSDGQTIRVDGTVQDVTERARSSERIRYLAFYDTLTGLPNRQLFFRLIDRALRLAVGGSHGFALLYLDLDRFKRINDTLGHSAGDQLLAAVAERLQHCLRAQDLVARAPTPGVDVARLGGDEFAILLAGVDRRDQAAAVAHRIVEALSQPVPIGRREFVVTPSVGIAMFPAHGQDVETLVRNADAAMYQAKSNGRNRYQVYTEALRERLVKRLNMEDGLRKAIDRNQLVLHYQPKVDIESWQVVGLEALVRWQHPILGLVRPSEFIRVAEESGLIVPLGDWVMDKVCAQLRAWHADGLSAVRVAVNLSIQQFYGRDLPTAVSDCLSRHGIEPELLELEITESMVIEDTGEARAALNALKEAGVMLTADDFGTGYSSMTYLRSVPLDAIKIDRSFVRDLEFDQDAAAVAAAIIAMGKSLNLVTIAEGVANDQQLAFMKKRGCDQIQGYLYSRPVPAHVAVKFLDGPAANAGREGIRLVVK